jgi:N-acetylmuramoyl-L-alanine amidase
MKNNAFFLLFIILFQAFVCNAEEQLNTVVIDPQLYEHSMQKKIAIVEKNTNILLDVAILLKEKLDASKNYRAVLTTHGNEFVSIKERYEKIDNENADIMISIGANFDKNTQRGFEIHVLKSDIHKLLDVQQSRGPEENSSKMLSGIKKDLIKRSVHVEKESKKLATLLHEELKSFLFTKYCRPLHIADEILVGSTMPSVVVILGRFTDLKDIETLKDPKNQAKIANLIYNAIDKYFGIGDVH